MRTRPYAPNRHGWTLERRAAFIAALRLHRSITRAAAAVAMSRESAYWLRRQPEAADFRRQWDAALRFVPDEAVLYRIGQSDPENWSSRRLVRWLQRQTEREDRAERAKMETS